MSLVLIIMRKETGRGEGELDHCHQIPSTAKFKLIQFESEGQASSAKALQYNDPQSPCLFCAFFSLRFASETRTEAVQNPCIRSKSH